MKKLIIVLLGLSVSLGAQGKEEDRLRACATVVTEILNMPDVPGDRCDLPWPRTELRGAQAFNRRPDLLSRIEQCVRDRLQQ